MQVALNESRTWEKKLSESLDKAEYKLNSSDFVDDFCLG